MDVLDRAIMNSRRSLGVTTTKKQTKRKREKVAPQDNCENEELVNMREPIGPGSSWSDEEAQYWRDKYESLPKHKVELELYNRELESGCQREANAVNVVKSLEAKLKELEAGSILSTNIDDKVEDQRRLLAFYEAATSMTIKLNNETDVGIDEFVSTVKNAVTRKAVRFLLLSTGDSEEAVKFVPKANVDLLPQYLQQSIVFESANCPILLTDVISNLYE